MYWLNNQPADKQCIKTDTLVKHPFWGNILTFAPEKLYRNESTQRESKRREFQVF
jgi:hypothetical protein